MTYSGQLQIPLTLVSLALWVNNRMFTSGHVLAPGASWTPGRGVLYFYCKVVLKNRPLTGIQNVKQPRVCVCALSEVII